MFVRKRHESKQVFMKELQLTPHCASLKTFYLQIVVTRAKKKINYESASIWLGQNALVSESVKMFESVSYAQVVKFVSTSYPLTESRQ